MHPCVYQRHCECLPGKAVIMNGAVRKKGPPILQGADPIEASLRFYILLWSTGDHGPVAAKTGSQAL